MAITQVTAPLSVPATNADWTNMTYHLKANRLGLNNHPFILTNSENTSIPALAIGSYIQFGDSLYIVDTSDYTIQGTPVDGNNYIRIEPSGTTLIATWIQGKSSYSWNPVNNYYEISASDYALLPYLVVKDGTEYEKYSMAMNASFGKVKATTLNTGHGDNELYPMNQNVRTTDSPTFAKLTLTTSTYGSQSIGSGGTWVITAGIYVFHANSQASLEAWNGSSWISTYTSNINYTMGTIVSDGSNMRVINNNASAITVSYRKFS